MTHKLFIQPVLALYPHSCFISVKLPNCIFPVRNLKGKFSRIQSTAEPSPSSSSSPDSLLSTTFILKQVSDSFDLPRDYFEQLPSDLRLDLNDAAFDLSNGPVSEECGEELGKILMEISRAWELADTSASRTLAQRFAELEDSLTDTAKSALGKRLLSAGRRFQAMGGYGTGEMQNIANAMKSAGSALYSSQLPQSAETNKESRVFKFGELQVAITADKANIGGVIGIVFGVLSWQLGQGVQSIPESSLQYANDNALLLAKSLRGVLLALSYSSAVLSAFTAVGLFFLARQLASKDD